MDTLIDEIGPHDPNTSQWLDPLARNWALNNELLWRMLPTPLEQRVTRAFYIIDIEQGSQQPCRESAASAPGREGSDCMDYAEENTSLCLVRLRENQTVVLPVAFL